MQHHLAIVFAALAAATSPVHAQGPSVLDLQRSYHVGIYSVTIGMPNGARLLLMQSGSLDLAPTGTFTGGLDTYEWTSSGGNFTPNDPLGGTYRVLPSGEIAFDFDPNQAGGEHDFFINSDGSAIHGGRDTTNPEALSFLALEKSSGQSNASLSGNYRFYTQNFDLSGPTSFDTAAARGTATLDGSGGFTATGTEDSYSPGSVLSTTTFTTNGSYSVAADGALVFDGSPGAMSANGDVFFFVNGSATSSEVGMLIAVRQGTNYDHNDLEGCFTVHSVELDVASSVPLPRTITDTGDLEIAATSTTTGTWDYLGDVWDGTANSLVQSFVSASGTTTLSGNGTLLLSDPNPALELAVSATGDFLAGRIFENYTSLFFAMRTCVCEAYGTGTAGTGAIEPELGMRTFPTLGNASWQFAITDGLGGAAAIMPIGFADAPGGVPLSGGVLWVDPLQIAATPFVVLGGTPGLAGAGQLDLPLPIPTDPSFEGVTLFAQALVLDPGAPSNVAMSRGFEVVFCK